MSRTRDFREHFLRQVEDSLEVGITAGHFRGVDFSVFTKCGNLNGEFASLDEFADDIVEFNRRARQKLDQNASDVYAVDAKYAARLDNQLQDCKALTRMLDTMTSSISDGKFNTNFDSTKMLNALEVSAGGSFKLTDLLYAKRLTKMPLGLLLRLDPSDMTPAQRARYFAELLGRLCTGDLSDKEIAAIDEKLLLMTYEDAFNMVFNRDGLLGGLFGGNQGMRLSDAAMADLVRLYFEKTGFTMTDVTAMEFAKALREVSCGHIAGVNTILMYYMNKPHEFEQLFGFPLYVDGKLNYDQLFIDYYMYWYNTDHWRQPHEGTVFPVIPLRISGYLKSKGASMYTEWKYGAQISVTGNESLRHIQTELNNGNVVLLELQPTTMYDKLGIQFTNEGGHGVVVTGVSDGVIEVSSWGQVYTVRLEDLNDPKLLSTVDYIVLEYKEK